MYNGIVAKWNSVIKYGKLPQTKDEKESKNTNKNKSQKEERFPGSQGYCRRQKNLKAEKEKGPEKAYCMRRLALFLIRIYHSVSKSFPRHCVYTPTCSKYAQEAFSRHSFFKALKLTLFRILRCNPFAKGGFDPVK